MNRRLGWMVAIALGSGCSLINDPDWVDDTIVQDMGPRDLGDLGDLGDMNPDMGDMNPDMGPPVELCGNGIDDDGDGLDDCADFDCLDQMGCCGDGVSLIQVNDWTTSELNRLEKLPRASSPTLLAEGGRITRFDPDGIAAGLFPECLPLALGATIHVDLYPQPDPDGFTCDSAGICNGFVQWVLSPADDIAVGGEILDELSVRVYPGLRVEIRRNRSVLETWRPSAGAPGTPMSIAVELGPGLDELERNVLRASLTISYAGMSFEYSTDAIFLADLLTEPGCDEVPGLYLALQGQGNGAGAVGDVSAGTLSCPNPGQFTQPTDAQPLTRAELDWDPGFTAGGLEAPTIVSEGNGPTFWHVMAAASNEQLELARSGFRVGYALGHSSSSFWNAATWSLSSEGPRYGDDPPSCASMPMSCPVTPLGSARDPFLLDLEDGTSLLAFAREIVPFEPAHGIYISAEPLDVSDTVTPSLVLEPGDIAGGTACESLRDPALIPTGDPQRYWLFYTCESGGSSTIRMVRLSLFAGIDAQLETDAEVLSPAMVGSFGAAGVRGAEPMVTNEIGDPPRDVIRVWFLAKDRSTATSIGVAVADVKGLASLESAPELSLYPANPVLRETDRALECDTNDCQIHGVAITDVPDAATAGLLRMLVARRVQVPGAGRFYDLFPLEQAWNPLGPE